MPPPNCLPSSSFWRFLEYVNDCGLQSIFKKSSKMFPNSTYFADTCPVAFLKMELKRPEHI